MQELFLSTENIPLAEVSNALITEKRIKLFIKRDDLIHQYISGNKWRKLKYNVEEMKRQDKSIVLTFGGAGEKFGFDTIGIIRGDNLPERNPVLKKAEALGMKLYFVSREKYRQKHTEEFISELQKQFGDFYLVPEGGANEFGVRGCEEIAPEIHINYTHICCCCGTGTTLAGISRALPADKKIIGFCVHSGVESVEESINAWTSNAKNYVLNNDYHFGGYAKTCNELKLFAKKFSYETGTPVEQVYTAKMFYGIFDLAEKNYFPEGSIIVALHSGGIHNQL
jgi:1-aminocyclopropane-1-carboxylate deaminase